MCGESKSQHRGEKRRASLTWSTQSRVCRSFVVVVVLLLSTFVVPFFPPLLLELSPQVHNDTGGAAARRYSACLGAGQVARQADGHALRLTGRRQTKRLARLGTVQRNGATDRLVHVAGPELHVVARRETRRRRARVRVVVVVVDLRSRERGSGGHGYDWLVR